MCGERRILNKVCREIGVESLLLRFGFEEDTKEEEDNKIRFT